MPFGRRSAARLMLAGVAVLWVPVVPAQSFPTKPVRVVVPFPPGPADFVGRLYVQKLAERWKQSVVVDNRPGATGTIGADAVAKAPADGYTMLFTVDLPIVMAPALMKTPYDPQRDFTLVAGIGEGMNLLAVHPSVGVGKLTELVAAAKAKPGSISFASAGNASPGHVCGEVLKSAAGIDLTHVPYKGAGPATQAVLSGEVSAFCGPIPALLPHVRSGKLRAVGVTGERASPLAADIEPLASTYPSLVVTNWYGFFLPLRTPPAIVEEVRKELRAVFDDGEIVKRLQASGVDPLWLGEAQLARRIETDLAKWARIVRTANIKAE